MSVVDASVLIAVFSSADAHHARAVRLLAGAGRLRASVVTLAEVLVGPARAGRAAEVSAALDALGVQAVGVDGADAGALAELRARTGLRMRDCCVLLAARRSGAERVLSFDERLLRVASTLGLAT